MRVNVLMWDTMAGGTRRRIPVTAGGQVVHWRYARFVPFLIAFEGY